MHVSVVRAGLEFPVHWEICSWPRVSAGAEQSVFLLRSSECGRESGRHPAFSVVLEAGCVFFGCLCC